MNLSDFDYELPPELIATRPARQRDASRLLVMDREGGAVHHRRFDQMGEELRTGDCLVLNDSRVIPARLEGRRASGGHVEILLLARRGGGDWQAMVKPARKLRVGEAVNLLERGSRPNPECVGEDGSGACAIIGEPVGEGLRAVSFDSALPEAQILDRFGRMPLPPYILAARKLEPPCGVAGSDGPGPADREDRERYQTVYAREGGSVAAPTAGLHFTPGLLERLVRRGVEIQRVTLHVGAGTFAPVKAERIEDHVMHDEEYEIAPTVAQAIEAARRDPARRVVAVGTTVTRTLESSMLAHGAITAGRESTRLMITPGFRFQAVEGLITNFHLPRSTLLMLVSAFAGREAILAAYREAIRERYRFFSYGDAMFIR